MVWGKQSYEKDSYESLHLEFYVVLVPLFFFWIKIVFVPVEDAEQTKLLVIASVLVDGSRNKASTHVSSSMLRISVNGMCMHQVDTKLSGAKMVSSLFASTV